MNCNWCEAEIDEFDRDGLCEECYEEWYFENHFMCCFCGEFEDRDHLGAIGSLLVIGGDMAEYKKSSRFFPAEPGVYRILGHPYFLDLVMEWKLFPRAVERVANSTGSGDGHACRKCSTKGVRHENFEAS